MKIQKKYQGTVPENKILDMYSESNTDTYSCNYLNNFIKVENGNLTLVSKNSGVTNVAAQYVKAGSVVQIRISFHAANNIANGSEIFTFQSFGPLIPFVALARSASNAIVAGANVANSNHNLHFNASGLFSAGDWYAISTTYICE